MKHHKNYPTLFLTFVFSFISSLNTFAHFGTKGPYGGTVTCSITYDTTVYIGTANGGVFESTTSKLVAWRARPVGLKSGKITALTHSGKDLYAATADSGIYIFNGYIGSDRYWQKINNGLGTLKIKSLLALDSVTIIAGTDGEGIYKTINKGVSWVKISTANLNTAVITGLVKAGTTRVFLTSQSDGVFISENKGDTWSDFNDVNTLAIAGTNSLSFNQTTNELIVSNTAGIFRTAVMATPVAGYASVTTGLPAATAIRSISNNGSIWLLATDKGIFTAPAASINWMAINTALPTLNVNSVVPLQTSLVAGTAGEGIFKASASNPSWVANNFGFNNLATYAIACSGIAVVVTATEKGVFVSKDLANTYKRANKGLTDSLNVTDLVFFGNKLLASTKNAGVFISADTGASWTMYNSGLMAVNIKKMSSSFSFVYLITADNQIFILKNSSWSFINGGLPSGAKLTSLVFYSNKVALGTYGNGVYTSIAGQNSWTPFNTGLSNLNVTSLSAQRIKLFAGTDGNGVFVSDTATAGWTATAPTIISHTTIMGLNGNSIQAMANYAGYIWASYKGGLLATSDYGVTWIAGGNQFNLPSYTDVTKIDFVTTRVFVTTENNCLYSNALSEIPPILGIAETTGNIGRFTVSPNPSHGILTIDLKTINGSAKQVIVYDLSGRKIISVQPTATLSVNLDLQVAPGMYYVQVVANEGTAVQKVAIE